MFNINDHQAQSTAGGRGARGGAAGTGARSRARSRRWVDAENVQGGLRRELGQRLIAHDESILRQTITIDDEEAVLRYYMVCYEMF